MMEQYHSNLTNGVKYATSQTRGKDTRDEFQRTQYIQQIYQNADPHRGIHKPQFRYDTYDTTQIGALKFPDDASLTVDNDADI